MTTLKISDRDAVVTQVLTEVFKPRFDEVTSWARDNLRASLKAEHSVFLKLAKDPESLPYLATGNVRKFYVKDATGTDKFTLRAPIYGRLLCMPIDRHYTRDDEYSTIADWDTVVPANVNSFQITNESLIQCYRSTWSDYTAACTELRALLNSYTTHERLTKDFPEYAKYLPVPPAKACHPVVIVKEVRAKLSKLGVPSKV